jgi:hypothetical protein
MTDIQKAAKKQISESDLQKLVDEFLKEKPDRSAVKAIFKKNGWDYSGDSILEMNTVLSYMSNRSQKDLTLN